MSNKEALLHTVECSINLQFFVGSYKLCKCTVKKDTNLCIKKLNSLANYKNMSSLWLQNADK